MWARWMLAAQTARRPDTMLAVVRSRREVCTATRSRSAAEREPKPRKVELLVTEIADRGGAFVMLRGPAAGQSPLLSRAARTARDRGLQVLSVSGADGAAHLPFAGLRRLLEPALWRPDELPRSCSGALEVAFGLAPGARPHPFRLAFAVLDLLAAAAADAPVVVVADDMHRLDRASADVLCIVARWPQPNQRVVVLLAGRAAQSRTLSGDALEQFELGTFSRPARARPVPAPLVLTRQLG